MKTMTRRDLFRSSLSALAATALAPRHVMGQSRTSVLPVPVTTWVHPTIHPRYTNLMWYQRVFGLPIMYNQVHQGSPPSADGPVVKVGDGPSFMLFRPGFQMPAKQHFCLGVKNFNLDRLLRALAEMAIPARAVNRNVEDGGNPEVLFDDPDGNGCQFQDERSCGGGGYLGDLCDFSTTAIRLPGDPPPIAVHTLNHVKYIVRDLKRSLAWYQKLTDMKLVTYQEVEGGPRTAGYEGGPVAILQVGAGPHHLALTEGSPGMPGSHARPHFGFGIKGFDAEQIMKRLAEHGVPSRLRMREGVTPEVLLTDPEGSVEIQLQDVSYCGGGGVLGNTCRPR
jgi:catechol 2,3-dioxygenase-like lactoylglutathione lyase family enzyme